MGRRELLTITAQVEGGASSEGFRAAVFEIVKGEILQKWVRNGVHQAKS